jgi:hypothetical protein
MIKLKGVEPSTLAKKKDGKSFAKPGPDADFSWFYGTDIVTTYSPHLIKASSLTDEHTLRFRGVSLENPDMDFGPNDTNDYEVDLRNDEEVYRHQPSTLKQLDPSGDNAYAILFLSNNFVGRWDPNGRLLMAQGDPKYPQVAEFNNLKISNGVLQEKFTKLQSKYDKARNGLLAIASLGNKSEQASKLQRLLEELTP